MSAPGWNSIMSGVEPTKHRYMYNGLVFMKNPYYKSFLWRAKHDAGLKTMAAVTYWTDRLSRPVEEDDVDKFLIPVFEIGEKDSVRMFKEELNGT